MSSIGEDRPEASRFEPQGNGRGLELFTSRVTGGITAISADKAGKSTFGFLLGQVFEIWCLRFPQGGLPNESARCHISNEH